MKSKIVSAVILFALSMSAVFPAVQAGIGEPPLVATSAKGDSGVAVGGAALQNGTRADAGLAPPRPSNLETYMEILGEFAQKFPSRRAEIQTLISSPMATAADLEQKISDLSNDKARGPERADDGPSTVHLAPIYSGQSALQEQGSYTWQNDLFYDTFSYTGHLQTTKQTTAGGTYDVSANGNLKIVSKDVAGGGGGAAFAQSDELAIDHNHHITGAPTYAVETIFIPKQALNSWFRVYNDERMSIILGSNIQPGNVNLYYYANNGLTQIKSLNVGSRYQITATYQTSSYDVDVFDIAANTHTNVQNIPPATPNVLDYFTLGDPNNFADFGYGEWEYLKITGMSSARWFEDFKDGNAGDWRPWSYATGATYSVTNQVLSLSSDTTAFNYAYTPFFDYTTNSAANGYWKVSFDFRINANNNQWLILLANDQFVILVVNLQLKFFSTQMNPTEKDLNSGAPLVQGQWYYLKLVQDSGNTYDIYLDSKPDVFGTDAKFQTANALGAPSFRLGDFNENDRGSADWDNFRVISGMGPDSDGDNDQDDDDDGLSDTFENNARQVFWADDFEGYTLGDSSVWRWSLTQDWEWGYLTGGHPNNAYGGSTSYIGTRIGAASYTRGVSSYAFSPYMSLVNVGNVEPTAVFNVWWHFADNADNCEVHAWWTATNGQHWDQTLATLNEISGSWPTGAHSSEWRHVETSINAQAIGSTDFQFYVKMFADNTVGTELDGGCFLDDISLLVAGLKDNLDGDSDNLGDGEEWEWARTSPYVDDTDGDGLFDKDEMTDSFLSGSLSSNGRADPLVVDFFYEVDRQVDVNNVPYEIPAAVKSSVIDELWPWGIRGHFWNDGTIANNAQWQFLLPGQGGCGNGKGPLQLQSAYSTHQQPGKTWNVLVMEHECQGNGVAGASPNGFSDVFVLNAGLLNTLPGTCTDTSNAEWTHTIHHEHGHTLGLGHYAQVANGASTWMVSGCTPTGGAFTEYSVTEWRGIGTSGL